MIKVDYDIHRLQQLFIELEPKRRVQALKGAFRRGANRVKRTTVGFIRADIRKDKDLERGVRALVFKRTPGFRVTLGTRRTKKKVSGFHTNRQGLSKPILIWADAGTKQRHTKSKTRVFVRSRKGHNTGSMPAYGFIRRARQSTEATMTKGLHDDVIEVLIRTAKKYGCK